MDILTNNKIVDTFLIYNIEILIGLSIGFIILLILNIISQSRISKITEKYNKLVKGSERENLEDMLLEVGNDMDNISNNIDMVEKDINNLKSKLELSIQKVGIVRFDAFAELGSGQSFSLACLDQNDTGFVLTSIYGRDYSSNYIKPINQGKPEYKLSVEEIQALDRARK